MADPEDGHMDWYCPDPRAILPFDGAYFSKSLRRLIKQNPFEIRFNTSFLKVIQGCAQPRQHEQETWINGQIITLYHQLHQQGYAHCVEAWQQGQLVGGVYGVAIGSAFFAESMFSSISGASKVCLFHLFNHLRGLGYTLLDVQFQNDHIKQFGVIEIPREVYLASLAQAIEVEDLWQLPQEGGASE